MDALHWAIFIVLGLIALNLAIGIGIVILTVLVAIFDRNHF